MPKNIKRLIKELNSDEVERRQKAIIEISKLKDPLAIKPLLVTLKDIDDNVRMWSAEALGEIGDRSNMVIDSLIDALLDSNPMVREVAEKAIQKIDPTFSGMDTKQIFQEYRRRYLLEKKFGEEFDLEIDKFKIIMVGDSYVGKTAFVKRWTLDKFLDIYKMTASANISSKKFFVDGSNVELEIWDLAGQESLLISNYFFGASGALLLFDKSDEKMDNVEKWYTKILELSGRIPIILIGNKVDLKEEPSKKGEKFANKKKIPYIETSVKTGLNVNNAFETLVRLMLEEQSKIEETKEFKKLMKNLDEKQKYFYNQFKKYVKNASYFCKVRNFDHALQAFQKSEVYAKKADFKEGLQWINEQKKYCEVQIQDGFKTKSSYFCKNCNRIYQLVESAETVCPVCGSKDLVEITQLRSLFAPLLARFLDKEEFKIEGEYFEVLIDMILEVRFVNVWNIIKYYQKQWNFFQIEVSKIDWPSFIQQYGIDLITTYLKEVFLFDEAKLKIELKEFDVKTLNLVIEYMYDSSNIQDIQSLFEENGIEYKQRIFEERFQNAVLKTIGNFFNKIMTAMEFEVKINESEIKEEFEGTIIKSALEINSKMLLV
ncbi:MAG: GTP-binding protein [Candidatus Helarchaeota archaeon]